MEFNATFIITIISFLVFVCLMNTILYSPLEKVVEQRKNLIDNNYKEAKDSDIKSKSLLTEKAEKIARAKIGAKSFIDGMLKEGYDQSALIVADAKIKSIEKLKEQKQILMDESSYIESNLESSVNDFANLIAKKLEGEDE